MKKQEYYIKREQDYRKTIDDIHLEIAKRSSDPFGFLTMHQHNQENDDSGNEHREEEDERKRKQLKAEFAPQILENYDKIMRTIELV